MKKFIVICLLVAQASVLAMSALFYDQGMLVSGAIITLFVLVFIIMITDDYDNKIFKMIPIIIMALATLFYIVNKGEFKAETKRQNDALVKAFDKNIVLMSVSCVNGKYYIDNNGTIEPLKYGEGKYPSDIPCKK